MINKFKKGDRVKIAKSSEYYGEGDSYNPIDAVGIVEKIEQRIFPIVVMWNSKRQNSYFEKDLIIFKEKKTIVKKKTAKKKK